MLLSGDVLVQAEHADHFILIGCAALPWKYVARSLSSAGRGLRLLVAQATDAGFDDFRRSSAR
jgi:hypothetical protein